MAATLTICDETVTGERIALYRLGFLRERVTVRELIRGRVYEEVETYNRSTPEYFRGLVQPADAEEALHGYRLRERRQIDWEQQFQRAVDAFAGNSFFILVDDHQVECLDQEIDLTHASFVSFIKLSPLVAG